MNKSLTPAQTAVLRGFYEYGKGTDVALATYVHHATGSGQSSSGIRTRRCELQSQGLVDAVGRKQMPSGKFAAVHALTDDGYWVALDLFGSTAAVA